ncbi:MAG TPA: hypothetical protein VG125_14605 [Pirellulales bacterium]|nr:hypothetical protein [Pirellulales bacterium]
MIVILAAGALTVGTAIAIDKRPGAPGAGASSKELVEAAQGAYEECKKERTINADKFHLEDVYTWSKRWMTAAQDLNPGEAAKAVRAHFDRMSELENSAKLLEKSNLVPKAEVEAARYYRAEAELMLSRAGE